MEKNRTAAILMQTKEQKQNRDLMQIVSIEDIVPGCI